MKLFIYGAGAHGRIALDVARAAGHEDIAFVDDAPERRGQRLDGVAIASGRALEDAQGAYGVVIAIGKPSVRLAIAARLAAQGARFVNLVHPSVVLFPTVRLGVGNILSPGVVLDTGVEVRDHCLVNPMVLLGHDCVIEDGVTISGGAVVGGRSVVARGAFLCLGARLAPRVRVGEGAIVGAASLVMKDVPPAVVATGVPARPTFPADASFDWSKVL